MVSTKKGRPITLRKRELQILQFVETHVLRQGFAPSQREIQDGLKIKHLILVQRSLARLKAAGKLFDREGSPRSLEVIEGALRSADFTAPLLGFVAAGRPIEAIENHQNIEIPTWMMKSGQDYFVLRVKGDSMIDHGIHDRDLVLIRKQIHAQNGQVVVALINNEATIKKFYRRADGITLVPANEKLTAMEIKNPQDFRIAGIFSGVLRSAE